MECIILAGGLGTRLQSVVQDVPKCMAPVNGKPFLHYLFDYAEQQGCSRVILSLGYKHEVVTEWLATQQRAFAIDYVIETEPLGTGGGIQLAMQKATEQHVIVLNGDTMFRVPLQLMMQFHLDKKAGTTIALKPMLNFDRYGLVNTDTDNRIIQFEEKKYQAEGLINGGVYIIHKDSLASKTLPGKFSFEKDYFEAFVQEGDMYGFVSDGYFIDIGIPSDYERAQKDLA
jgi:D-glycero-alpha-D-manno-heptose 1-phosphate guanylyltransferase